MPVTQYLSPTSALTVSGPGGTGFGTWTSAVAGLTASDNIRASLTINANNGRSNYLVARGFFVGANALPTTGLEIKGFEVRYERRSGAAGVVGIDSLVLLSGSNQVGTVDASSYATKFPTTEALASVAQTMFGLTTAQATAGLLNSPDFGVGIAVRVSAAAGASATNRTVDFDAIQLKVIYTYLQSIDVNSYEAGYKVNGKSSTIVTADTGWQHDWNDNPDAGWENRQEVTSLNSAWASAAFNFIGPQLALIGIGPFAVPSSATNLQAISEIVYKNLSSPDGGSSFGFMLASANGGGGYDTIGGPSITPDVLNTWTTAYVTLNSTFGAVSGPLTPEFINTGSAGTPVQLGLQVFPFADFGTDGGFQVDRIQTIVTYQTTVTPSEDISITIVDVIHTNKAGFESDSVGLQQLFGIRPQTSDFGFELNSQTVSANTGWKRAQLFTTYTTADADGYVWHVVTAGGVVLGVEATSHGNIGNYWTLLQAKNFDLQVPANSTNHVVQVELVRTFDIASQWAVGDSFQQPGVSGMAPGNHQIGLFSASPTLPETDLGFTLNAYSWSLPTPGEADFYFITSARVTAAVQSTAVISWAGKQWYEDFFGTPSARAVTPSELNDPRFGIEFDYAELNGTTSAAANFVRYNSVRMMVEYLDISDNVSLEVFAGGGLEVFSSEYEYESGSIALTQVHNLVVQSSEYGYEAASVTNRISINANPSKYGYESSQADLRQILTYTIDTNSSKYGYESGNANISLLFDINVNESEYGHEIEAALNRINMVVQSSKYGYDTDSVDIVQDQFLGAQSSKYGYDSENIHIAIHYFTNPESCEYGYETGSAFLRRFQIIPVPFDRTKIVRQI